MLNAILSKPSQIDWAAAKQSAFWHDYNTDNMTCLLLLCLTVVFGAITLFVLAFGQPVFSPFSHLTTLAVVTLTFAILAIVFRLMALASLNASQASN